MPTTTYTDITTAVQAIGSRTDSSSTPVNDYTAEEVRLNNVLTAGAITDDAFLVTAGTGMSVDVGNGATAKKDVYVLAGAVAGQGKYLVRLSSATENLTISPAHATLNRIDEIYVVVLDNAYDAIGPSLPRLAVRQGDNASSPSAPGADGNWEAYALLCTVEIPAATATSAGFTMTDERTAAAVELAGEGRLSHELNDPLVTTLLAPTGGSFEFLINGVNEGTLTAAGLNLNGGTLTGNVSGNVTGDLTGNADTVTLADTLDGTGGSGSPDIKFGGTLVALTDANGLVTDQVTAGGGNADLILETDNNRLTLEGTVGNALLLETGVSTALLDIDNDGTMHVTGELDVNGTGESTIGGNLGVAGGTLTLSDGTDNGTIVSDATGLTLTAQAGDRMDFVANANNSLRLTTGGTVQILAAASGSTTNLVRANGAGGATLRALQISTSTERIKRDIVQLDPQDSAAIVDAMKPSTFYSIAEADVEQGLEDYQMVGFIAERMDEVAHNLASHDDDGAPSGINLTGIVAHLVAAHQAQSQEIAELRALLEA